MCGSEKYPYENVFREIGTLMADRGFSALNDRNAAIASPSVKPSVVAAVAIFPLTILIL